MRVDIDRLKILMTEIHIGLGHRFDFKRISVYTWMKKAIVKGLPIQNLCKV